LKIYPVVCNFFNVLKNFGGQIAFYGTVHMGLPLR
jgi:hypothetical protein